MAQEHSSYAKPFIPEVADLNEKLFSRFAAGKERSEASWDVLEWWVTPIPDIGGAPKDLIGTGSLSEAAWDAHLPGAIPPRTPGDHPTS